MSIHIGSTRDPDRIGAKIARIHRSYKIALDQINQSGNGLEGAEHESFFTHIRTNVCKYYDVMHEAYGESPSSFALWTNEMQSDDEKSSTSSKEDNDDYFFHDESSETESGDKDSNDIEVITNKLSNVGCNSDEESKSPRKRSSNVELEISSDDESKTTSSIVTTSSSSLSRKNRNSRSKNKRQKLKKQSSKDLCPMEAKHKLKSSKKTIFAQKTKKKLPFHTTDEDSKRMSEYFDVKKEVLQRQSRNETEQLAIAQQKIKFDERRLLLEEKVFEANMKKDIAVHNLEMLKMRKEAKELQPELNDEDINKLFPFRC